MTFPRADLPFDELYQALVESAVDYAICFLDPQGHVVAWNLGTQRLYQYEEKEILEKSFSVFFEKVEDEAVHTPEADLKIAITDGRREQAGWHLRKNGSRFWAQSRLLPRWNAQKELTGFFLITRDLTERQHSEEIIRHQAYYDALTGLPNRILFDNRLHDALIRARHEGRTLALFFLDVDHFKTINDTFGHAVGDRLLQQMSERLKSCLQPQDFLARLGGDEYLLFAEVSHGQEAEQKAAKLVEYFHQPFRFDEHEFLMSISIGISIFPQDGEDSDLLIRNADTALYRAKQEGRNTYQVYNSAMSAQAAKRLTLVDSMRRALKQHEFVLYYQPQIDTMTGEIVGMEALVRWEIPGFGLVMPGEFIPVAEETGLIMPIGEWILQTACQQNKAWQQAGQKPLCMAVNLSARQFQQRSLVQNVSQILKETGLPSTCLELEITESHAMQNADFTVAVLRELKSMGVRISIDDFGTGYSSLSYLKKFPIDTLKIDRSFVKDLCTDPNDAAIAEAIIALAHSLRLDVVAEGVETQDQYAMLRNYRCDRMQGYLFSRAIPANAFEKLTREQPSLLPTKIIPRAA